MIQINLFKENKQIKQIELSGHAGYDDSGYDIVCAAVSSQVISIENSLEKLLNIHCDIEVDEVEGGYLKLTLPQLNQTELADKAQLLLQHLEYALIVISESYPSFVKVYQKNYKP